MIDTEIVSFHIYQNLLKEYNIDYQLTDYTNNYSGHTLQQNINNIIKSYNLNLNYQQCLDLVMKEEKEIIFQGVDLKKGLIELLDFLKENNYKTAIATSSTKERCLNILKQHNIESYFDCFVFADDITHSKPNPEIYLKALEKLNVKASDALVLEDAVSGILAADAANIDVICIPDMKKPQADVLCKTVAVLQSLNNVIDFLKKRSIASLYFH